MKTRKYAKEAEAAAKDIAFHVLMNYSWRQSWLETMRYNFLCLFIKQDRVKLWKILRKIG